MVKIFIYLIIIIIIIIFNLFPKIIKNANINYLSNMTQIPKESIEQLYILCNNYSKKENLIVESSIKCFSRRLNVKRFSIPIFYGNFMKNKSLDHNLLLNFCRSLTKIFFYQINEELNQKLVKYISNHLDHKLNGDIIVGYDGSENTFKIYVDDGIRSIECLEFYLGEFNLKRKIYTILSCDKYNKVTDQLDQSSEDLLHSLGLINSNYRIVYIVSDHIFHVIFKNPYRLIEKQINAIGHYFNIKNEIMNWYKSVCKVNCLIHVIGIKKKKNKIENLSLYLRPNNLVTIINKYSSIINLLN